MKIIRSLKIMTQFSLVNKHKGKAIGFVPTMGALHQGHLSLIRRAHKENDMVVVSIFVNPIQFGFGEDFKKYPRDLKRDANLCRKEGVDAIFYPNAKNMYGNNYGTYITVSRLSEVLCGKSRPGHFKGVATVVAKLFNIVQPDKAYFGQKDAQQAIIIKKMVEDLNMPLKIKVMPTVREKDGLAMSSRNAYLNPLERKNALVLPQAFKIAKALIKNGVRDSGRVIRQIKSLITHKGLARIDYIAIVDAKNLRPVKRIVKGSLIALAVRIGKTRLIDNLLV